LDDELSSLVQLHTDGNIRAGMSPQEAKRAAYRALGSRAGLRSEYATHAGLPFFRLMADASREAVRSLVRHPVFSAVVLAVLSLGVGATVALATLVDTLLFRPPAHVLAPERLVDVTSARNYVLFQEVQRPEQDTRRHWEEPTAHAPP
jgi:macrolide transport system ATP-binding/permease protein